MFMMSYVEKAKSELEKLLGCSVEVVEDRDSRYPAKIEWARNYGRERHVVRVNPTICANGYPIFSMLLMAKLQLQRMPDGAYGILQPVSSREESMRFAGDFRNDRIGRVMIAHLGASADSMIAMLQNGVIVQCCNQVLEALMSDVVAKDYPEALDDMKAYLAKAAVEGAAKSHEEFLATYPEFVVTANRLLNLFFAMKCGEVCGKDLIGAYKPTLEEIDRALDLYNYFRTERDQLKAGGKIAGDVVKNFLREMKVDRYAHLVLLPIAPSESVQQRTDDGLTPEQRESQRLFSENHGDGKGDAELMTLGIFKALRELRSWPLESVRSLAVEIATLGMNGIAPSRKYTLKGLPNRGEMYGEEVLAYYYVTWAKVFPDKVGLLGLPYKAAYDSAVKMLTNLEDNG